MHQRPKPVSVLVVDDREPFRRAMAAVVDATPGFEVSGVASTGEEAVNLTAELRPDLVLMDVHLPGIDGVEASRQITSATDAPIVFLLSTYDESDIDLADCGASSYLPKSELGPERLDETWQQVGAASQR